MSACPVLVGVLAAVLSTTLIALAAATARLGRTRHELAAAGSRPEPTP